jgi:flagellar biosynthesis protein FliP
MRDAMLRWARCLAVGMMLLFGAWAVATAAPASAPSGPAQTAAGAATKGPSKANGTGGQRSSASPPAADGLAVLFPEAGKSGTETATAVRYVLILTLVAILPSLLICLTAFLRIVIVLSMLRHAIGMPETPPNTVLIGLALFLTLFTMNPVLQTLNTQAVQPFLKGQIGLQAGVEEASRPLRGFMVKQTREQDLALMVELSKSPRPETIDDIGNLQLIPAFMLSELRAAFQIGFVIFLPFLLIDLIVSSILMSLGMMMMPPITIALPIKVLMFILVDGWSLIIKALVSSFH